MVFQIAMYNEQWASWWLSGKRTCLQRRRRKRYGFKSWIGKIPWRRAWQPTPVSQPGEFHGQRSLAGYSPCGHKESDMIKHSTNHLNSCCCY